VGPPRGFGLNDGDVLGIVKEDQVCRRLMTAPSVGAVISLTYCAGIDDPGWFITSQSVGAYSAARCRQCTAVASDQVRHAQAVGENVAKRQGIRRTKVALAGRLATALNRI
jgi:transposase